MTGSSGTPSSGSGATTGRPRRRGGGAEIAGGQDRAGDLERAADFSREPNVHLGPERYRTIRGGASETVKQAGRVELLEEQVRQLVAQQDADLKGYIKWSKTLGEQVTHLGEQVQQLADQHASELKGYIGWSENMAEQQGILNAHVEKLTKAYNELARLLDEG